MKTTASVKKLAARSPTTDGMDAFGIAAALAERFGEEVAVPPELRDNEELHRIASHRVHRRYSDRAVTPDLIRLVCMLALSAPSKSDLQQRDIVVVEDPELRARIADFLPHMPHVRAAPAFLVFCANGARIPQLADLRGKPFPNDHLDLFANAFADAAIALATAMRAAEAIGLGCCPISEIRNQAAKVSEWLELPPRVIPFAGFCLGWPAQAGQISPRLPSSLTLHKDRYRQCALDQEVQTYDRRRMALQPYEEQREPKRWGRAAEYGWSEEKARQYANPERSDFGSFVRGKGFSLD